MLGKKEYKAVDIARIFVRKGIEDASPVTQMKLQKLVFFAHGLYLAATGSPLVSEEFQAWQFGPVIPDIYQLYKYYGNGAILELDYEHLSSTGWGAWKLEKDYYEQLSDEAKQIVDETWLALKDANAIQLSNWTHKENSAWSKVYKEGCRNITIPNKLIKEDFKQFINK